MNNKEFLRGVEIIETVLQKKIDKKQLEIYYMLLADIPVEKYIVGIKEMLLDRVYTNIPSPAEIKKYCAGNIEYKIEESKRMIKKAIQNYGAYKTVCFPDPLIHFIIKNNFGSWVKLCRAEIEEFEKFFKWDFPKLYKIYSERKISEVPIFLEGIESSTNKQVEKIYYIENEEKCKKWQEILLNKKEIENINLKKLELIAESKTVNSANLMEIINKNKIENKTNTELWDGIF